MRLKDKVALFASAGSNMSRATMLPFAQAGAKVVLAARTTETMEETAERIRANGDDVLTHQTDLTNTAQVDTLVDVAVAEFGDRFWSSGFLGRTGNGEGYPKVP